MLLVNDMPIRAQSKFAAHVQAKGLFAANASGRGCLASASTGPDTGSERVRSE